MRAVQFCGEVRFSAAIFLCAAGWSAMLHIKVNCENGIKSGLQPAFIYCCVDRSVSMRRMGIQYDSTPYYHHMTNLDGIA